MADEPQEGQEIDGAPTVLTSRKASPEEPMREHEADTVEWVESMFETAKEQKRLQCDPDSWDAALDTWWGDQWPETVPSYKPRIVVNEIQSLGLQELSDLTDSRLTIYVQKDRQSTDRDKAVEDTIQTYWMRQFCDLEVLSAALDALIFPLGFFQSGWDPLAAQGQGEVVFEARDPRSVFPDGDAKKDEQLRYFLLRDIEDLMVLRRNFPETGYLVSPEAAYSEPLDDRRGDRPEPRGGSGYVGPLYTQTPSGGVQAWKKARARVLTCVVDDDDLMEELHQVKDEAGLPRVEVVQRARYPHRRLIMVANRRVLYDEDCPYHHAPILTSVNLQPRVHAYWPAQSIVASYATIQATANKLDSMVAENGLRLNLGELFADADSGITPQTYGNIPGGVYLLKPGSKAEKRYPPPMPADMVGAGERNRNMIRGNFGYPMSRTGAGTHGNVAAELAETEISQSMGLTRLRGRLLYQAVQRGVEMIFARQAQFYTTPRHLPYIADGDLKSVKWEPIAKPENYAVHVDPASFQVRSKTMMQRLAMALAKMGKMPTKRLLKFLDFPDADKIAEELTAELALMAAAKMRQGKGKGRG